MQTAAKDILERIIRDYQPEQIFAFGSFARGEMQTDSDLDLCLIKKNIPISPIERRLEVYRILSGRKIPLDIIVYKPEEFEMRRIMGDPFIATILTEGKKLYG